MCHEAAWWRSRASLVFKGIRGELKKKRGGGAFERLWICISPSLISELWFKAFWVWRCQHTVAGKDERNRQVCDDSSSPQLFSQRFNFLELASILLRHARLLQLLASKMWTSCCLCNILKSHNFDLKADTYDLQTILKPQTMKADPKI